MARCQEKKKKAFVDLCYNTYLVATHKYHTYSYSQAALIRLAVRADASRLVGCFVSNTDACISITLPYTLLCRGCNLRMVSLICEILQGLPGRVLSVRTKKLPSPCGRSCLPQHRTEHTLFVKCSGVRAQRSRSLGAFLGRGETSAADARRE